MQSSSEDELYQDKDYFAGARENAELWYEMQLPIIKDIRKYKKGGTWLDIGSGLGFLPQVASQHGFKARGIDLNQSVVNEGQIFFHHPVTVQSLDDIDQQSFDIISINHVIEHVEHPRLFIEKAAQKLKVGGIMIIGVPNINGGIPRLIRIINRLPLKKGSKWLWHGYQLKQHLWHFSPESILKQVPTSLKVLKVNQSDNMYYGFLKIKKIRYQILAVIFSLFQYINMGDNLRVILKKSSHE